VWRQLDADKFDFTRHQGEVFVWEKASNSSATTKNLENCFVHFSRSADDPRFGAVKLNKLLFDADFQAYVQIGSANYRRRISKTGAGPAPKRLIPIRDEMISFGLLAIQERSFHGKNAAAGQSHSANQI